MGVHGRLGSLLSVAPRGMRHACAAAYHLLLLLLLLMWLLLVVLLERLMMQVRLRVLLGVVHQGLR